MNDVYLSYTLYIYLFIYHIHNIYIQLDIILYIYTYTIHNGDFMQYVTHDDTGWYCLVVKVSYAYNKKLRDDVCSTD
jgi:hypothetical protein